MEGTAVLTNTPIVKTPLVKKACVLVALVVAVAMGGKASAQVSINVGYMHQEHTFAYQNGVLDSMRQSDVWLRGGVCGLSLSVPLIGKIGITPGVYVSFSKLQEMMGDSVQGFMNPTTSTLNFKMPFLMKYKIPLGTQFNLLVFAGPVFNMGISSLANYRNVDTQLDLHFDMGGSVVAALQFHHVHVFLGYNASLIDRDDFNLADKESIKKAWEGSSLFFGAGISLGENPTRN